MELMRGHHSVGEASLHLQFTKYRRCVFRDEGVQTVCEEGFRETAGRLGLVIHALAFGPDHVYVFVGACRNHSLAEAIRRQKDASSKRVRQKCGDRVRMKLWGDAFWSGGYFYLSVGSTTGEAIQYYIQNSQQKHWIALDYEEYKERKDTQTTINQFTA
jgi:REP element-mobilizing transposase RayT